VQKNNGMMKGTFEATLFRLIFAVLRQKIVPEKCRLKSTFHAIDFSNVIVGVTGCGLSTSLASL
jgi:hypothetical protein